MRLYQDIISRVKETDNNVVNLYMYGSRVYGTSNENSDHDFIMVVKDKICSEFSDNKMDVHFYTVEEFDQRLIDHEINAIESYFLSPSFILKQTHKPRFELNKSKLRDVFSAKASNSFVKAKKKLIVEKDYNLLIAKKSLWHSFRIPMFGIQICKYGKIIDYTVANQLYSEIVNGYKNDWDSLFETYKQEHNKLMTEFRLVAPKI